jgi:type IV pilus assembly protein PilP
MKYPNTTITPARIITQSLPVAMLFVATVMLAGCANDMDELQNKVAQIKANAGEKIQPLPPIQPYESYKYDATAERSPFVPSSSAKSNLASSLRPSASRPREFLEQFSLDTMQMVGTLQVEGRNYGLVQAKDGLVHRVQVGNHIGQADGRIAGITNTRISVIELVPDGMGGYIERPAALTLKE